MRIFKYIFKMSMLNTLISFLVIIGLVWVSQSFRSIKFIFEKGGTIIDFFQLSIFSMPAWLSISVSFGFFFGVFITFTKLENDRELIAMKSSGLNSLQLSYPKGLYLELPRCNFIEKQEKIQYSLSILNS